MKLKFEMICEMTWENESNKKEFKYTYEDFFSFAIFQYILQHIGKSRSVNKSEKE